MINVITSEPAVVQNPFPGMNLAEACNAVEVAVIEACNDFEMNVLLTEHAYLYANGTEMQYVDEAGQLNEKAAAIKEKAIELVKFCGQKLNELWEKAKEWVLSTIANFKAAIAKRGITDKHASYILANWRTMFGIAPTLKVTYTVDNSFTNSGEYRALMNNKDSSADYTSGEVVDMYVKRGESTKKITPAEFGNAVDAVVNKSSSLLKAINTAKKDANDEINAEIKTVKQAKEDGFQDKITNLKKSLKINTRITNDLIKVYHMYVNQQVAIASTVLNSYIGKKMISKEAKKDRADRVEDVRNGTSAAASNLADRAKAAPGKAANAVANGAKGAVDAVKNAPENVRKHFTKKD